MRQPWINKVFFFFFFKYHQYGISALVNFSDVIQWGNQWLHEKWVVFLG